MIKESEIGQDHEKIEHNLDENEIAQLNFWEDFNCFKRNVRNLFYIFGHWQSEIIQVTDNASLMDDFLSAVIYQ